MMNVIMSLALFLLLASCLMLFVDGIYGLLNSAYDKLFKRG
jgi:hypothetical protein